MKLTRNEIETLRHVLSWFIHDSNRSGRRIGRSVADMYQRLELAHSISATGNETVCNADDPESLEAWIDSRQVAEIWGRCERQVRNRAKELGGRKRGGRWFFPESAVQNFFEEQRSA